jgi:hypothetical protein
MSFEIFVVHVQSVADYNAVIFIYKTGNKEKVEQESITPRHATTVTKNCPR